MSHRALWVFVTMAILFTFSTTYYKFVQFNERIDVLSEKVNDLKRESGSKELALVKMIAELQPTIEHEDLYAYKNAILDAATKWNISPILLAALVFEESSFKRNQRGTRLPSGVQCIGPMQIHPALHKEKLASRGIKPKDLHDIALNIDIGAEILKENLEKTRYDVRRSLFKYVGGRSPVYVNNIINNYVRFDA